MFEAMMLVKQLKRLLFPQKRDTEKSTLLKLQEKVNSNKVSFSQEFRKGDFILKELPYEGVVYILVFSPKQEFIAYISFELRNEVCLIDLLYVIERYRMHKVGKFCVDYVISIAKLNSCKKVTTDFYGPYSKDFFKALGFQGAGNYGELEL